MKIDLLKLENIYSYVHFSTAYNTLNTKKLQPKNSEIRFSLNSIHNVYISLLVTFKVC